MFVISTFKREMHRPSLAKLWQMPHAAAEPSCPFTPARFTPLEVHAASYFAASDKMRSFSMVSICVFMLFSLS